MIRPGEIKTALKGKIPFLVSVLSGLCHGSTTFNLAPFVFFPVMCLTSPGKKTAYTHASLYYIAASWGVYGGAPVFFGVTSLAPILGLFFWLGTALSLALPWGIFWTEASASTRIKAIRLMAALALVIFPPLGLYGWANPLLCAGYLLPGAGVAGIAVVISAWVAVMHLQVAHRRAYKPLLFGLGVFALTMSFRPSDCPLRGAEDWENIDTEFGRLYSGSDDTLSQLERFETLARLLRQSKGKYVVLPETVGGFWGDTTEDIWNEISEEFKDAGRTYLVGAETCKEGTAKYFNVVQVRGANKDTIQQRYPVPVSMWKPYSETGAAASWFEKKNGLAVIDGKRVGILICYEPYLYIPCFITVALKNPDVLVAVSNSWWCRDTNLPAVSDNAICSWALLFDVPVVIAKNK
jgi:hypothetical protein